MKNNNGISKYLFLFLSVVDIGIATIHTQFNLGATQNSAFVTYYSQMSKVMNKISDKASFRIGTTFSRSDNDPMLFNYNGLSHYSSSQPVKDIRYLSALGYYQLFSWAHWTNYNSGSTLGIDSLLGIKYIVNNNDQSLTNILKSSHSSMTTYDTGESTSGLTLTKKYKKYFIYKNSNVFKLAFASNKIKYGSNIRYDPEKNEFKNLNLIFRNLSFQKLYKRDFCTYNIQKNNAIYKVKASHDGIIYMQIPSSSDQQPNLNGNSHGTYTLTVNGKRIGNISNESENGILKIGYFKSDDIVKIMIRGNSSFNDFKVPVFYSENSELLSRIANDQNKDNLKTKYNNDSIMTKGNVTKNYIVYSVPFDSSWRATVNGKNVLVKRAFGNLVSVPVSNGKTKVTLRYIPKGLKIGAGITLFSLLIFVALIVIRILVRL